MFPTCWVLHGLRGLPELARAGALPGSSACILIHIVIIIITTIIDIHIISTLLINTMIILLVLLAIPGPFCPRSVSGDAPCGDVCLVLVELRICTPPPPSPPIEVGVYNTLLQIPVHVAVLKTSSRRWWCIKAFFPTLFII